MGFLQQSGSNGRGSSARVRVATAVVAGMALPLLAACTTVAEQRKLERRVYDMEKAEGRTGDQGRQRLASLAARVEQLDAEVKRLSGRLEVAEHQTAKALEEARAARLAASGRGGRAPGPEAGEPAPGEAGSGSAELIAYRGARDAWSQGQPKVCIDRFREFLQTYPSSSYAENASYWMADCYFKRGDYKTAILRFDDVVARYPGGQRAPDALYRQGEALLKLGPGYGKAAGKAFERVIAEYPESARATEAKKQLELLGAG